MASLVDHGLVKTTAAEQVVAPIAGHLCHLVLLCDSAAEPERFTQLEDTALAVAKATKRMAAVASRQISETEDEVLQMEMSSLLESVSVSGQHVLLTAQKLSIQPALSEHKEELITAAQNVLLGVVKVLVVDDDATVRKILAAADQVLECLGELGSSLDIVSLLKSFKLFSEALLLLNHLTMDRAKSLQDPRQAQQLFDSLETLRKCVSMLHTAMCTTIKHPASEQAQASKRYILDKVESTVNDIIVTLKSDCHRGSLGPCGYYTGRRNSLVQLLTSSFISSIRGSGFDSMVRDLVFHCMVVANSSRKELQQRVVGYCRHVLQFWSDITRILKFPEDPERPKQNADDICSLLLQQIEMLDRLLMTTVLYQVLDTFTMASSTFEELVSVTRQVLDVESTAEFDPECVQPLLEDFLCLTDRIIQVTSFISAFAIDAKSLENVENSRTCLSRLRSVIAPLSLELDGNSLQTVQKLHDLLQRWEEDTAQLHDSLSDVMDVREFTSIAIHEMVNDRRGCDAAYKEQSYEEFDEHARDLVCHMKQVTQSVKRHLDKSDNPIYRNGLLVLLKQVQSSQTKVLGSVEDMLCGSDLNVEAFSPFSDDVSMAIQHFKVLREGLDGQQHPHLLSPLRENVRQPVESPSPPPRQVKEADDTDLDQDVSGINSPVLEDQEEDFIAELEEEYSRRETVEGFLSHKYDDDDLKLRAPSDEPRPFDMPLDVDLLPLLNEVVTVTKGKDVTALNRACTSVLELSNCFAQAAKEASMVVDAVDCQTLDDFRAELVSLTPLLVQTAQETAMSSGMSTESVFKHSALFSDLINNIRKVLLPVAGTWYHSIYTVLQGNQPNMAATVGEQLGEVVALCGDVVQLLMSSDVPTQKDCQESFTALQNKLNKAQNNTRHLIELVNSLDGQVDQLEAPCILWALSIQILLSSLDKVLGTSTAVRQVSPQKRLSALSENSLRIQEAARLTGINCKSAYKVKQLTEFQEELKIVTETYLQAAEELNTTPSVLLLAKSEFLQRKLLMKLRLLCGHLSKANKDYIPEIQSIVNIAYLAAENHLDDRTAEDAEQRFENAAQVLFENVKGATKRIEDCFNYVRDPRARSNLKSINDHLSFQISDIVSRARLIVETRCVCDTLGLEVQTQCWSAKAHYMVQEVSKLDGIRQEARELIQTGLQGRTPVDVMAAPTTIPTSVREIREFSPDIAPWHKDDTAEAVETNMTPCMVAVSPPVPTMEKHARAGPSVLKDASSLAYTSLFLKQETDSWDPKDNRIVQVTRKMADKIYYMTQYLRKKGPIANKEAFVNTAKEVISDCQSVTQFVRVIANHCVDKQCTVELSLLVEQILTVTNQLSIISSVNAVTPSGCKSSNEILVKNAQNLLQTVLLGVRAAETACIKGLTQPEPNSDGAEAAALCFQWKRNLQIHRAQQYCSLETDDLGLRKTSSTPVAPSLASPIHVQEGFK